MAKKKATRKAAKKRFKASAGGRVRRGASGLSHLMSTKRAKRRRQLRKASMIAERKMEVKLLKLLGVT